MKEIDLNTPTQNAALTRLHSASGAKLRHTAALPRVHAHSFEKLLK